MKRLRLITPALLFLLASALSPPPARAANVYWTSPSGTWFTPNGWSDAATAGNPRNAPGSGDTAYITGTLTLGNASAGNGATYIGNGAGTSGLLTIANTGTLNVTGNTLLGNLAGSSGTAVVGGALNLTNNFVVGHYGHGHLEIAGGGIVENKTSAIGWQPNSSGAARVAGVWKNRGNFNVGNEAGAVGTLDITSTGTVTAASYISIGHNGATSSGSVSVEGLLHTSSYISVGNNGAGVLDIKDTGTVSASGSVSIGNAVTSSGSVSVAGLLSTGSSLHVGNNGAGMLDIKDTGTVSVKGQIRLGNAANSLGTGTVAGFLKMETADNFYIGHSGAGALDVVSSGSVLVGNALVIANGASSSGTASVAGRMDITQNFYVGSSGAGVLNVTPGGLVSVGGHIRLGNAANSLGTGTIAGCLKLSSTSNLYVGYSGSGVLDVVSSGSVFVGNALVLGSGATSSGTAGISGRVDIDENFLIGDSGAGALTIGETGTVTVHGLTRLGSGGSGKGSAIVEGEFDIDGNLLIGNSGAGALDVRSGGRVLVGGTTIMGTVGAASGTLALNNGGVLETGQIMRGSGTATFLFNGGTIRAAAATDNFFVNFTEVDFAGGALMFDTQAFSVTATNAFKGTTAASLTKFGAGTLVLDGVSTAFSGMLGVKEGALEIAATGTHSAGTVDIAPDAGDAATLRVLGVLKSSNVGFIGNAAGASGTAFIEGALEFTGNLAVGNYGYGYLEIAEHGAVHNQTAALGWRGGPGGAVKVAGLWNSRGNLNVGNADGTVGSVEITPTGSVTVGSYISIGHVAGASGSVSVEGLLRTDRYLSIGNGGSGALDVKDTGTVSASGSVSIGNAATSSGSVSVAGLLSAGSSLHVGNNGTGMLDIKDTGTVSVKGQVRLGSAANSLGSGTIAGFLKMETADNFYIGYSGTGALDVVSSGSVFVGNALVLAHNAGSSGTAGITGRVDIAENFLIGNNGAGALTIGETGTVTVRGLTRLGSGGSGKGSAFVYGEFDIDGNLLIGNSGAGTLDVRSGGRVLVGGTTIMGTAGAASGTLALNSGGVLETGQIMRGAGTATFLFNGGTIRAAAATGDFFVNFAEVDFAGGSLMFDTQAFSVTATNAFKGTTASSLTKFGAGTLVLDGVSTAFSGTLGVKEGALEIAATGTHSAGTVDIAPDAGDAATLRVLGVLKSSGVGFIGNAAGSSGTAFVEGALEFTGNLAVGNYGYGYLEIAEHGAVHNQTAALGWRGGPGGAVKVAGLWNSRGNLNVGNADGTVGSVEITPTGSVTVGSYISIGHVAGASGNVSVEGLLSTEKYIHIGNGAGGAGVLDVKNTGTVTVGEQLRLGNEAATVGSGTIAGHWTNTGNIYVGYYGAGFLKIETGGTLVSLGSVNLSDRAGSSGTIVIDGYFSSGAMTYVGGRDSATFIIGEPGVYVPGSSFRVGGYDTSTGEGYGYTKIEGVLDGHVTGGARTIAAGYDGVGVIDVMATGTVLNTDVYVADHATSTGTLNLWGHWESNGNAYIANSSTNSAVINIHEGGRYIATDAEKSFIIGRNANTRGNANVAGLLDVSGNLITGSAGVGTLAITPTGTVFVGGLYRQNQNSTLAVTLDPSRTDAYITAGSASLSGTLVLDGAGINYASVTKASELPGLGALIINATSGTIGGGFTAVTGVNGAGIPGYLSVGGQATANDDGSASYHAGYRLAWNAMGGAHGTFEIDEGRTFEIDTPLSNRFGEVAAGWDGRSLTKQGAGTLILSAQNTFEGALNIVSGTVRLGGPAAHRYSGTLVNNGAFDFGNTATANYRSATVGGLSGNGAIHMNVNPGTGESDSLIIDGNAEGKHHLVLSVADGATAPGGDSPAPELVSFSKAKFISTATFTGGLDVEGANYAIVQGASGTIILATNGQSDAFSPISSVHGAQSVMWFASQDNLYRRIGELRSISEAPSGKYSAWLRARAENSSFSSSTNMRPFDMDLYGFELGADKTVAALSGRLAFGAYLGYGHATQDFEARNGSADGASDQLSLGAYAAWLNEAGWFANATITGALYDNEFTSNDQSGSTKGDYDDTALGLSLEFGKRIALDKRIGAGWFAEPSAQLSLVRLMRDDYRTTSTTGGNNLNVDGKDATIARLRGTLRAGRSWKLASSHIEIAGRVGAAHETSSGGKIRVNNGAPWRPNVDGTRCEAGAGLIWRPTVSGQLYFDYEFATGDGYQKPWSISLGYRHAF